MMAGKGRNEGLTVGYRIWYQIRRLGLTFFGSGPARRVGRPDGPPRGRAWGQGGQGPPAPRGTWTGRGTAPSGV